MRGFNTRHAPRLRLLMRFANRITLDALESSRKPERRAEMPAAGRSVASEICPQRAARSPVKFARGGRPAGVDEMCRRLYRCVRRLNVEYHLVTMGSGAGRHAVVGRHSPGPHRGDVSVSSGSPVDGLWMRDSGSESPLRSPPWVSHRSDDLSGNACRGGQDVIRLEPGCSVTSAWRISLGRVRTT